MTLRIRIGSMKPKIIQGMVGSNLVDFIFVLLRYSFFYEKIPRFPSGIDMRAKQHDQQLSVVG